jgi:magnesium chelatase family protein
MLAKVFSCALIGLEGAVVEVEGDLNPRSLPADLRKEGPAYDLPIAAALLSLSGQIPPDQEEAVFLGELSLDGSVRHVDGILPMTYVAKEAGYKAVYVPQANAPQAALVEGIDVYLVDALARLATHYRDYHPIEPYRAVMDLNADPPAYAADFMDIYG